MFRGWAFSHILRNQGQSICKKCVKVLVASCAGSQLISGGLVCADS